MDLGLGVEGLGLRDSLPLWSAGNGGMEELGNYYIHCWSIQGPTIWIHDGVLR